MAHLHLQGIHIHYYLDWLIYAPSKDLLLSHLRVTLKSTQSLGFLINWEKSSLSPSEVPTYLGAVLDNPRLLARPADHQFLAIQQLILRLVSQPSSPDLLWQQFLGHLSSFKDLVTDCLFLIRPLQLHFLQHFRLLQDPPDLPIPLTPQIKSFSLRWSFRDFLIEGRSFLFFLLRVFRFSQTLLT